MEKYINKFCIISILTLSIIGCSKGDLDLQSQTALKLDDVLNPDNQVGINSLLNGVYDAYQKVPINEHILVELRSDNTRANTLNGLFPNIDSFRITATLGEAANYWSNNYSTIAQANLILNNQDFIDSGATEPDDNKKEEIINQRESILGEAYFLRALCHFNLVRAYGKVPYIDRSISLTNFREFPRLELEEVYQKIVNDFRLAIQNLEGKTFDRNRANEHAANILLAKVLLSQPNKDYGGATTLLERYVESNSFGIDLVPVFSDIFGEENERNEEIIFSVFYEASGSNDFVTSDSELGDQVQTDAESFTFAMSDRGASNGVNLATPELLSILNASDEPDRFTGTIKPLDDPSLDINDPNTDVFNLKYSSVSVAEPQGNDWIVLRFADALLLYSEAILAGSEQTTDANAIEAFNRVRRRANVEEILTGELLTKDALLRERRVEFAFENQRFYDLIRLGEAETVLSEYSLNNNFSFSPSRLLLPIPQRERDASGGFYEQNPGY